MSKPVFIFGEFELDAGRRVLTRGTDPIHLGSRAMDLLIALVERPGVMLGAGQLTQQIWPDTFVDESNLRVHIAAIRKALRGAGQSTELIENLPGAGYRFAAPVIAKRRQSRVEKEVRFRPPPLLTSLIGRAETVRGFIEDLPLHRLITIVGAAGIGKTSVALAVGNSIEDEYANGVCFVDLTSVAAQGQIAAAIASAFQLSPVREDILESLLSFISDKHLLLVLDNCEHHLDETAQLVESMLQVGSKVAILATSREPLGAQGEWLRRLKALDVPQASAATVTVEDALTYSAVQLFAERARAVSSSFHLTDQEATSIAELCRQLDGLPLAIELAAARVDTLAVKDIADQLRASIALLSRGRRTAQLRHRTLAAALDWSYELLPEEEQIVFARLGVFQSRFTRQAALAIVSDEVLTAPKFLEALANLAAKSMALVEPGRTEPVYRLLDTTRTYATEKLGGGPAADSVRRRHAEYLRAEQAEHNSVSVSDQDLPQQDYRPLIDELRSALRWCFSDHGDPLLGIHVTVSLASNWYAVTLFLEFSGEVNRTLERLKERGRLSPETEMQLLLSFIPALYNTEGSTPQMYKTLEKALALADEKTDPQRTSRLRLLKELWQYYNGSGEHAAALAVADEFERLLGGNHDRTFLLQRIRAVSYLNRGDLQQVRENLDAVFAHPANQMVINRGIYEYDPQVVALFTLARTQWLQGFSSQSRQTARLCVQAAVDAQHPASLCVALALASCPISLWCGDRMTAEQSLELLRAQAVVCPLAYWQQFGDVFERALGLSRNKEINIRAQSWRHRQLQEACVLDGGWIAPALLEQVLAGERHWFSAEVLRREAQRRLEASNGNAFDETEELLQRSLLLAREGGALSWEFRTAISLAQLLKDRDTMRAYLLLQELVERFSEGYDTADYMQALTVLSELEDRLAKIMHVS
ncbi:ATP-binding protein [Acidicapsa ligni]|uniref:ATP-binding protein n=1 Tax=Acidicapsa ligni TaxID=542300 RepID=UPI0021E0D149|nr:helix-turn-helix transcriptional regulator [Acidicapsa ligni]